MDPSEKPKRPPILSVETRGLLLLAVVLLLLYLLGYRHLTNWSWRW